MTKVALAQVAASEDRESNVQQALDLIKKAGNEGVDLICFPEMGFDRFFPQFRANPEYFDLAEEVPGPTTSRLAAAGKEAGIVVVANLFERATPGIYYNCSPVLDSNGTFCGKSRMAHIAEAPLYNEKYYYHPGNSGFEVFKTNAGHLGIAICYDRHYPEQLRILALGGCEILLVPLAAIARDQWSIFEMEMQVASYQNQFFSVVVNRVGCEGEMEFVGRSFVSDPFGNIVARAVDGEPELLIVDIDLGQIEKARRVIHHMRDRRPELYGRLVHFNLAKNKNSPSAESNR